MEKKLNDPTFPLLDEKTVTGREIIPVIGEDGQNKQMPYSLMRDRKQHRGLHGGTTIYASDYDVKADLVYEDVAYNRIEKRFGQDPTANLQAALNDAGKMVPSDPNLYYEGNVRVVTPAGRIPLTSTLFIPPNVILDSEHSYFYNFLSDAHAPIIHGARRSHATYIAVHANAKNGVTFGDPALGGVRCDSRIGFIYVEHAGVDYNAALPPNRQKCGLRVHGLDFKLERLEVKEANIGFDCYQASDVLVPTVFMIGCSVGVRLESCEQVILPSIALDTTIQTGVQIDNSNNNFLRLNSFVNSHYGTPMECGVVVGRYSQAGGNKNNVVDYTGQSTGGYLLEVSNTEDCEFFLRGSNSRTFSQRFANATSHWQHSGNGELMAHDIGTNYHPYGNEGIPGAAIKYGRGHQGYLKIYLTRSSGIKPFEGNQYGSLRE